MQQIYTRKINISIIIETEFGISLIPEKQPIILVYTRIHFPPCHAYY